MSKLTTIFLSAACPTTDHHVAQLIKRLKTTSDRNFRFLGIGGPESHAEGLESIGVDSKHFIFRPLYPYKNAYPRSTIVPIHPVHAYNRFLNWQAFNTIQPKLLDIIHLEKPKAFITFENEFFMKGFYKRVRTAYQNHNKICPPTLFYGMSSFNQEAEYASYLDHFFSRVYIKQQNYQKYTFSNTQIGYEGMYKAFRFLLEESNNYKDLVSPDGIYLPTGETFRFDDFIGDIILEQRKKFREQQGIADQDLVLFFATGNTEREIRKTTKVVAEGIKALLGLEEMKNFPASALKIFISVPEFARYNQSATHKTQSQNWPCKITIVSDEKTKFNAMAASDIGIAPNGCIISEFAAFQLPSLILDCKAFFNSYFTQMYNSFDNDLNIASQGTVYPELILQTIPNKIAYSILEHYQDPKLRYYYAKRLFPLILNTIGKSDAQIPSQLQSKFQSVDLIKAASTYDLMANRILKGVEVYENIQKETTNSAKDNFYVRTRALQDIGWAKGL